MFKNCVKALLISVLLFMLIAAFFRHRLCRFLICKATARTTGLQLTIEKLNLDVLNNSLRIGGITLFNPPGFKNEVLGRAKEIFIKYDLLDSLSGRLRLRQVKADISEINIIRNGEKRYNLSAFKFSPTTENRPPLREGLEDDSERRKESRPKVIAKRFSYSFLIDRLELSLEKVTFLDYNAEIGGAALIIFTVKGPCVFKNISDLGYVANSVSAKGGFRNLLR